MNSEFNVSTDLARFLCPFAHCISSLVWARGVWLQGRGALAFPGGTLPMTTLLPSENVEGT